METPTIKNQAFSYLLNLFILVTHKYDSMLGEWDRILETSF